MTGLQTAKGTHVLLVSQPLNPDNCVCQQKYPRTLKGCVQRIEIHINRMTSGTLIDVHLCAGDLKCVCSESYTCSLQPDGATYNKLNSLQLLTLRMMDACRSGSFCQTVLMNTSRTPSRKSVCSPQGVAGPEESAHR